MKKIIKTIEKRTTMGKLEQIYKKFLLVDI